MSYIVIDVREPDEYASGHVTGSINIPPSEMMNRSEKLRSIPKDADIILYCRTGSRSNVSKNIMQQMGYTKLNNGINMQQVKARFNL